MPSSQGLNGTIWSFRLALAPWMKTTGGKAGAFRRGDVDVVQDDAVDVGKAAGGRVAPFDQPGVHTGDAGKDQNQR